MFKASDKLCEYEKSLDILGERMSVSKFCRIAFGLTWDGLDTQLIDLTCGSRRKHHLVFQFGKESIPERVILKHVQNTRDTDLSTGRAIKFTYSRCCEIGIDG